MIKLINCKTCSNEIASKAKTCPHCGAKNKKPFYAKWWVWLIAVIVLIIVLIPSNENGEDKNTTAKDANEQAESPSVVEISKFSIDSLKLINFIYENSELRNFSGITIKVDELTKDDCVVHVNIPSEMGTNADVVGHGVVILMAQWIAQSEDYTLHRRIRCLVITPTVGVTGQEMMRWWGTARYNPSSDGIDWEWRSR